MFPWGMLGELCQFEVSMMLSMFLTYRLYPCLAVKYPFLYNLSKAYPVFWTPKVDITKILKNPICPSKMVSF